MILKGGYTANDTRLGRVPEFDDRSRAFPATALLGDVPRPSSKHWRCDPRLDQGSFPRCVGYAWTADDAAAPIRRRVTDGLAVEWYDVAQRNDQWPGENYPGSSTLGGAKAGVILGKFHEYRWCFGIDDLVAVVTGLGPVVVGTNWYRGMFTPEGRRAHVRLTGPIDGGHEWLVRGVDQRRGTATGRNSWSAAWGRRGDFEIALEDLDRLLVEDGDACHPVRFSRT